MTHRTCFLAILFAGFTLPYSPAADAQQWARKMFPVREHDFGQVARGAKAEYAFEFENLYLEDIHIAGVRSSCGCTTPRIRDGKDTLKTYEKGAIIACLNNDRFLGSKGATLTVTIDRPFYAEVQLHVRSYIRGDVIVQPGSIQFGEVAQGEPAKPTVQVRHLGGGGWQVTGVTTNNPHLTATVGKQHRDTGGTWYELTVAMDGDAPVGYLHDHLLLTTNDHHSEIPVPVEGRVTSGITVSPSSLFLGVVEPDGEVTRQLVVRGKKPFRILNITCGDDSFRFETAGANIARPLHLIPVTFKPNGTSQGKITCTIRIETDLGTTAMPELPAYAVVGEQQ